jgi:hypothetical protein
MGASLGIAVPDDTASRAAARASTRTKASKADLVSAGIGFGCLDESLIDPG